MVKFRKDFYEEDRRVEKRDSSSIKAWMKEKEVSIVENGRNKVTHLVYIIVYNLYYVLYLFSVPDQFIILTKPDFRIIF